MKRLEFVMALLAYWSVVSNAAGDRPVALFVQVSDLHLSRNSQQQFAKCGDRDGDLKLLASTLLQRLQPSALLLTGDLVDNKDSRGKSVQYEEEWKMYQDVIRHILSTGIDESAVLDIRGNHDVFDMPQRLGKQDHFPAYSVEGQRDPSSRVYITALTQTETHNGTSTQLIRNFSQSGGLGCPLAFLLGVDTTQEPGFRGPTNFVGMATEQLLQQVDEVINTAKASCSAHCSPPIISYGHHPLSTIAHPRSRRRSTGRHLDEVLAAHGVSLYLNGHLHSAFGQKVHRMRPLTSGGYMAELETAAWKDDRRIRILTLDNDTLAFADLFVHTPSRYPAEFKESSEQYTLHSLDASRTINGVLLLITQPPDAHYSRLGASGKLPRTYRTVRGLAVPLTGDLSNCQIELNWLCVASRHMGTIAMTPSPGAAWPINGPNRGLYSADLPVWPCGSAMETQGFMELQMTASCPITTGEPGEKMQRSTSESRLVASRMGSSGHVELAEPHTPLPIPQEFLEWFVVAMDWPKFGELVFWCLWITHSLFMLIVPRALAQMQSPGVGPNGSSVVINDVSGWIWSPGTSFSDLLALAAVAGSGSGRATGDGTLGPRMAPEAWHGRLRASLMAWISWPIRVLKDLSSFRVAWTAIFVYSMYLLIGPWFLARLLSDAPPALFFAYGMSLKRSPEGSWEYERSPDTFLVTNIHMFFVVLPMTLWTASVLSSWKSRRSSVSSVSGIVFLRLPLTWAEVVWGGFLFGLHGLMVHHLSVLYGPLCALASPAFGWTSAFFAILLYCNVDCVVGEYSFLKSR